MPTKRYEIVSPNIETSFYYLITYHSLLQLSTVSISMSILLRHEMKHWPKFLNIIRCIIMRPVFCICCMQSNFMSYKNTSHILTSIIKRTFVFRQALWPGTISFIPHTCKLRYWSEIFHYFTNGCTSMMCYVYVEE